MNMNNVKISNNYIMFNNIYKFNRIKKNPNKSTKMASKKQISNQFKDNTTLSQSYISNIIQFKEQTRISEYNGYSIYESSNEDEKESEWIIIE